MAIVLWPLAPPLQGRGLTTEITPLLTHRQTPRGLQKRTC